MTMLHPRKYEQRVFELVRAGLAHDKSYFDQEGRTIRDARLEGHYPNAVIVVEDRLRTGKERTFRFDVWSRSLEHEKGHWVSPERAATLITMWVMESWK